MSLRIVHLTRYRFDAPVDGCQLQTCVEPDGASFHQIVVTPLQSRQERYRDEFGNRRQRFDISGPFETLEVQAISTVGDAGFRDPAPLPFFAPSARVPELPACASYAREGMREAPVRERVEALIAQVAADFTFDPEATDVESPIERFVELRRGVCQDFAHFTIGCLRSLGIAAAYVSGYREGTTSSGHSHAWVAARDEVGSWIQLDPTAAVVAPRGYTVMAIGRDYDDVPPIAGAVDHRGRCRLLTRVSVERLEPEELVTSR